MSNESKPGSTPIFSAVLPFPLPTWNALLAASPWRRRAIRKWIHHAVSICTAGDTASLTPTELVRRRSLTVLSLPEYLEMIRPSRSSKARQLHKKKSGAMCRKKR